MGNYGTSPLSTVERQTALGCAAKVFPCLGGWLTFRASQFERERGRTVYGICVKLHSQREDPHDEVLTKRLAQFLIRMYAP